MASQSTVGSPAGDRWAVAFVRIWAAAHVLHLVMGNDARLDTLWNIGTVAAAIAVLHRPRDGRFFAVMAVFQIADYIDELPYDPNHWTLAALINTTVLITFAARRDTSLPSLAAAFPAVRALFLIAYSAAAVSKYNTDFLDPVMSCAAVMADQATSGLTTRAGVEPFLIAAVLATETAVPLLLLLPATRRHGVRIALLFHAGLSISPNFAVVDFTLTTYAIYWLFLPQDDASNVLDRLAGWSARSAIARDVRRFPRAASVLGFVLLGLSGYVWQALGSACHFVGAQILILGLCLAVVSTWRRPGGAPRPLGRLRVVHVPMIALMAFWVANPYLGLRNTAVFTMFSNLQTEKGVENHLFMPTVRLTEWQSDIVVLRSSNAANVQWAADRDLAVPLIELRREAMENPDLVVTGTLHGARVTFGPGHIALDPLPAWERKVLLFRGIPVGEQPYCTN